MKKMKVINKINKVFTFDFESRNSYKDIEKGETSIWLWDICDYQLNHFQGENMESFIEKISELAPCVLYSHNLKFDSSFIISWMLANGYKYKQEDITKPKEFMMLMDEMSRLYSINLCVKTKKGNRLIQFRDSAKKLSGKVKNIAESYQLPIRKGEIDYRKERDLNYKATPHELEYIKNDTEIIERVLIMEYEEGFKSLTSSSDAFHKYVEFIGQKNFDKLFPQMSLEDDQFVRSAYKGAWCYANPKYKGKILHNVKAFDKNSMYTYQMCSRLLPYGKPLKYKENKIRNIYSYPLFITHCRVCCHLKPNSFPCIQTYKTLFAKAQWLTDTLLEMEELYLTSVDYEMLYKYYIVDDIEIIETMYFHASTNLFKEFLMPIYELKCNSKGSRKMNAKKLLNSCYGKFGQNPRQRNRKAVLDEDGVVKYIIYKDEVGKTKYCPESAFITAWGRYDIVDGANRNYNKFAYCDTDSLHIICDDNELPNLDIDSKKLGAFKIEHDFNRVKYIGTKCYYGEEWIDGKLSKNPTIAGLSKEEGVKKVDFETFEIGEKYESVKLTPRMVKGGIVLLDSDFVLRER